MSLAICCCLASFFAGMVLEYYLARDERREQARCQRAVCRYCRTQRVTAVLTRRMVIAMRRKARHIKER
jgi:hypothetical protein